MLWSMGSTNDRATILVAICFGAGCLLFADDEPKQFFQVTKTERLDFPSGGLLRLKNSIGEVMVEGFFAEEVSFFALTAGVADHAGSATDERNWLMAISL